MSFNLDLPSQLRAAGWKVKIRDKERVEPPHVTILHKWRSWRLGLRDRLFLDEEANWNQIADGVRQAIFSDDNWRTLIDEWDALYPRNPVRGEDDE